MPDITSNIGRGFLNAVSMPGGGTAFVQTGDIYVSLPPPYQLPIVELPFLKNPYFVGREKEIKELNTRLGKLETSTMLEVIRGVSGVGKTRLAIEYAYYAFETKRYQIIWWIAGSTIIPNLLNLADQLKISRADITQVRIEKLKQKLNQLGKWLLVFDDISSYDAVKEYFPKSNGHILITASRDIGWPNSKELKPLELPDATNLLNLMSKRHTSLAEDTKANNPSPAEEKDTNELVNLLSKLPLAIVQAAAYMKMASINATKYIEEFRMKKIALLGESQVLDHEKSVAVTWNINFEAINSISPNAAKVLQYCAYLDKNQIPIFLLTECMDNIRHVNHLVGILRNYMLVEESSGFAGYNALSMHNLVQTVIRGQVSKDEQNALLNKLTSSARKVFPSADGPLTAKIFSTRLGLAPHFFSLFSVPDSNLEINNNVWSKLRWVDATRGFLPPQLIKTKLDEIHEKIKSNGLDVFENPMLITIALADHYMTLGMYGSEDEIRESALVLGQFYAKIAYNKLVTHPQYKSGNSWFIDHAQTMASYSKQETPPAAFELLAKISSESEFLKLHQNYINELEARIKADAKDETATWQLADLYFSLITICRSSKEFDKAVSYVERGIALGYKKERIIKELTDCFQLAKTELPADSPTINAMNIILKAEDKKVTHQPVPGVLSHPADKKSQLAPSIEASVASLPVARAIVLPPGK